jgi:hypothetical protein
LLSNFFSFETARHKNKHYSIDKYKGQFELHSMFFIRQPLELNM